ncbi:glycoside hydrolase family 2 protein, partial [bacterium]|nr:glycoside hydrolase family 2 protein [bacterium]
HYGWDWGPRFVTSGIWRPVYLEAWDSVKIRDVHFILDTLEKERALYRAVVEVEAAAEMEAVIKIAVEGKGKKPASRTCILKPGLNRETLDFVIEKPRLWWPNGLGEPYLYDLKTTISLDGLEMDRQTETIGVRTIKLVQNKDERGKTFYFEVNGVPVFAKGANYIPNDNFLTRVTPEKYEHIVKSAREANMNMLRVWGGGIYENGLFYDLCDRYGILLWHDFMFACSLYPGDDAFLDNVRVEASENIRRLRNHPSIALWCGNNEIDTAWSHDTPGGWGWKEKFSPEIQEKLWGDYRELFYHIIADAVSENDASRSYWPSSPLADYDARASYSSTSGDIHYWGVWHGLERFEAFQDYIGRFMSEYGFQSFPSLAAVKKFTVPSDWDIESDVMRSHQRSGYGNRRIMEYMDLCHRKPKDFPSTLYVSQVMQADAIQAAIEAHRRSKPYCMGTLFWQINDCWPVASWSSIDYYGEWKALQYFAKKAYADVIVSPFIRQGNLEVTVISDLLKSFKGTLAIDILDFEGRNLKSRSMPVSIPPNSSSLCFRENTDGFLQGLDVKRVFLRVGLEGPGVQASNQFYFVPSKDLDLPRPAVDVKVKPAREGFSVELRTDRLAKNLFLSAEGVEGFFSDNYFDLLPGEEMRVFFRTRDLAADFQSQLKWTSLVESY